MGVENVQMIVDSYSCGGITAAGIRKILLGGKARTSTMVFGILYSHSGYSNGGQMVRRGKDVVKKAGRMIVRSEEAFGKVNADTIAKTVGASVFELGFISAATGSGVKKLAGPRAT